MTVKELITELRKLPPNTHIKVQGDPQEIHLDIDDVMYIEEIHLVLIWTK